jgi:hypothetical protein
MRIRRVFRREKKELHEVEPGHAPVPPFELTPSERAEEVAQSIRQ